MEIKHINLTLGCDKCWAARGAYRHSHRPPDGYFSLIFYYFPYPTAMVTDKIPATTGWSFFSPSFSTRKHHILTITMAVAWRLHTVGLASQERIFSRVSGSLSATRPPQTRAAKAKKMGMILVTPMNAAKMKLATMAASLLMPLRMPNAVPLQSSRGRERVRCKLNLNDLILLILLFNCL